MGRFMIEEPSKTARELFVEELRRTYDKGWDVKNTPESKANNIMTIYGTVAALLFGFGALFLRNLHPDYAFLSGFVGLLIAGIIASVAAIGTLQPVFQAAEVYSRNRTRIFCR